MATLTHAYIALSDWLEGRWGSISMVEALNGLFTLAALMVWVFSVDNEQDQKTQVSQWIIVSLMLITCLRWTHGWMYMVPEDLHIQILSGLLYLPLMLSIATLAQLPWWLAIGSILWMSIVPLFQGYGLATSSYTSDWRLGPSMLAAYLVFYFFLFSITKIVTLNKSLSQEAYLDPLTNTLNRRGLFSTLSSMPAEAFSVLLLDIDRFKQINDTCGHDVGDIIIRTVAKIIKGCVRSSDSVCRWGGEEFLVVLHTDDIRGVHHRAEVIRQQIAAYSWEALREADLSVTISIGLCCPATDFHTGVIEADKALYRAKSEGRDCVRASATTSPPPST